MPTAEVLSRSCLGKSGQSCRNFLLTFNSVELLGAGAAGTVQTSSSGNNDKILVMGKGSGVHYS